MKYVAILEIEDDVEIVGDIEAVANYTYRDNGTNYAYTESVEFKLEQEPKTGHWIDDMRLGYHVSICSNCDWRGHGDTCLIYKPKYCPNCGARMESEEK